MREGERKKEEKMGEIVREMKIVLRVSISRSSLAGKKRKDMGISSSRLAQLHSKWTHTLQHTRTHTHTHGGGRTQNNRKKCAMVYALRPLTTKRGHIVFKSQIIPDCTGHLSP